MNGRIGSKQDGIHGISTGFKGTPINDGSRTEGVNSGFVCLFLGNSLDFVFLGFSLDRVVIVVVKEVGNVRINVKHHDVQNSVGVNLERLGANGMIGYIDEPMVRGDGPKCVAISIQTVAEIAVAVEILQFLVKGLVRPRLISGKVEVLAAVSNPINLQSQFEPEIDQDGDASQKGGRPAGFQYQHVGIDK